MANTSLLHGAGDMIRGDLLANSGLLERLGHLFYMVEPDKTTYRTPEEVPAFFRQAWPLFLAFILLENLVLWLEHKPVARLNDSLTSISHGLFQECGRLVFRGAESWMYMYIYNNWRVADLPWDSALTWYLALICVDFCYYWVHRASHEVHILWAQHQVHHSSEDYNLAVGLRQSVLQGWCGFVFYLPLALVVPPAHFLTHQQFNLLYQFWIHTETVNTLGPLEWVFNTPKHHRVHHGCNLYCLDKNYGGFLIIWDRLFGTFADERPKEETIYGLVFNQPSFNPFFLQVFYNKNVVNKVRAMTGWKNKVSAVVKGPSWLPGRPWTGAEEDKIDVKAREKYDVRLPLWLNVYLLAHFVLVVLGFQELALRYVNMNPVSVLGFVAYILMSLTTIGMVFDGRPGVCLLELLRCGIFVVAAPRFCGLLEKVPCADLVPELQLAFGLSGVLWLLLATQVIQIKIKMAP